MNRLTAGPVVTLGARSAGSLTRGRGHWSRGLAVSIVVLLGLSLVLGGCSRTQPQRRRVVLLALDGGTWELLDRWIKEGKLPNLARIRNRGAWGPLRSIVPSSSPVIWTTVATGKSPDKHGITNFVRLPDGPGKPRPVDRTMRRTKALWNMLGDEGLDVAVVGWFVTWPAEEVNGRLVSDRAHYGLVEDRIWPPAYLSDLLPYTQEQAKEAMTRFMRFDYDPARVKAGSEDPVEQVNFLVFDRFVRAWLRDAFYIEAAKRILADGALPDFLALYLRGTDDVQHGFWKFMQPQLFDGVSPKQAKDFGQVIERYWQWIDEAVGEILSHYDDNTLVVVASDHGAGPAVGRYAVQTPEYLHLSGSHRDRGILMLSGPGMRRGQRIEAARVHDLTPTILHYLGLPVGEDMDGRVLTELFSIKLAPREVARVASWDDEEAGPEDGSELVPAAEEEILEHLRSLGYIH
ncbi:MAG: alkaline phosphatase family protein [Candidatus Binatia bacterium]